MEAEADAYDATLKPDAKPEQPIEEVPNGSGIAANNVAGDSIAAFLKTNPPRLFCSL